MDNYWYFGCKLRCYAELVFKCYASLVTGWSALRDYCCALNFLPTVCKEDTLVITEIAGPGFMKINTHSERLIAEL